MHKITFFARKKIIQKLEDLTVLKRSPDLLNNVKIGQDQLQLIIKHTLAQSSKCSPLNHHVLVLLIRAFGSSLISRETSWNDFLYDISQYNISKHEIKTS